MAAFLLYIVISRMVQSEREEIGLMKAFGYTNLEVGAHSAMDSESKRELSSGEMTTR